MKRLYDVMTEVGGMREHHKFLAVRMLAVVKKQLQGTAGQLVSWETGRPTTYGF